MLIDILPLFTDPEGNPGINLPDGRGNGDSAGGYGSYLFGVFAGGGDGFGDGRQHARGDVSRQTGDGRSNHFFSFTAPSGSGYGYYPYSLILLL